MLPACLTLSTVGPACAGAAAATKPIANAAAAIARHPLWIIPAPYFCCAGKVLLDAVSSPDGWADANTAAGRPATRAESGGGRLPKGIAIALGRRSVRMEEY